MMSKQPQRNMKRIDHKFAPALPFPLSRVARPMMVRKGERGSASELLSREQQAQIDRHMQIEAPLHRLPCSISEE